MKTLLIAISADKINPTHWTFRNVDYLGGQVNKTINLIPNNFNQQRTKVTITMSVLE